MTVTCESTIDRLAALPEEIEAAERRVASASIDLDEAKDALQLREAELLTGVAEDGKPVIRGANEAVRKAELLIATEQERGAVGNASDALAEKRVELSRLQNEFAAARSISRLLASLSD